MMDDLAAWIASITWPLVTRVFASLGVGALTYKGADTALTSALDAAKAAFLGLGADVLQLLTMAGVFDVMSITSGGLISGLAWLVMKRYALLTTGGTSS